MVRVLKTQSVQAIGYIIIFYDFQASTINTKTLKSLYFKAFLLTSPPLTTKPCTQRALSRQKRCRTPLRSPWRQGKSSLFYRHNNLCKQLTCTAIIIIQIIIINLSLLFIAMLYYPLHNFNHQWISIFISA